MIFFFFPKSTAEVFGNFKLKINFKSYVPKPRHFQSPWEMKNHQFGSEFQWFHYSACAEKAFQNTQHLVLPVLYWVLLPHPHFVFSNLWSIRKGWEGKAEDLIKLESLRQIPTFVIQTMASCAKQTSTGQLSSCTFQASSLLFAIKTSHSDLCSSWKHG